MARPMNGRLRVGLITDSQSHEVHGRGLIGKWRRNDAAEKERDTWQWRRECHTGPQRIVSCLGSGSLPGHRSLAGERSSSAARARHRARTG